MENHTFHNSNKFTVADKQKCVVVKTVEISIKFDPNLILMGEQAFIRLKKILLLLLQLISILSQFLIKIFESWFAFPEEYDIKSIIPKASRAIKGYTRNAICSDISFPNEMEMYDPNITAMQPAV